VTIGGLNEVKVFRTSDFSQVATIPVGALPHGIWPSGDGNRVYVGLENGDGVTAIDTLTHKVIATVPVARRRKPSPMCVMRCRQVPERKTYNRSASQARSRISRSRLQPRRRAMRLPAFLCFGLLGLVALRQYASVLLVPLDDEDGFIINAVLLALWRNSSSLLRA
jgi:YVTN family beta-propeller protein